MDIDDPEFSLIPFHGFSPALKSLSVSYLGFPFSQILNLIRSFPLIEDLSLTTFSGDLPIESDDSSDGQQTQPPFTGTLELFICAGMDLDSSQLLFPPDGCRFRTLDLWLNCKQDGLIASVLVERCRFTLESLRVRAGFYSATVLYYLYPYQWLIPVSRRAVAIYN
jgi:hypothetical protein